MVSGERDSFARTFMAGDLGRTTTKQIVTMSDSWQIIRARSRVARRALRHNAKRLFLDRVRGAPSETSLH